MHPITSTFTVLAALGILLIVSAAWVKRGLIAGEAARKLVHVGMGVICMAFPWLFSEVLPVQILGIIAVILILTVRSSRLRTSIGSSLFSVKRISIGELLFPIAVAWLFTLNFSTDDSPTVYYIIPLLLLTLADTAGAIAGTRFGKRIYQTTSGNKSLEGSIAFFLTAFICTAGPLYFFTSFAPLQILYLAITVSLFITAIEGAAGMGMDNLFIPLGTYFMLDYYQDFSSQSLWIRAISLVALLGVLLFTRTKHSLNGGALLTAALLCFIAFMQGGWLCLAACLCILLRHILTIKSMSDPEQYTHSIDAVLAISAPAITWLIIAPSVSKASMFIASLAITIGMLHVGTQKFLKADHNKTTLYLKSISLTAILSFLSYPLVQNWVFLLLILICSAIAALLFYRIRSTQASALNDWIWLCAIASLATTALYFIYDYSHSIL